FLEILDGLSAKSALQGNGDEFLGGSPVLIGSCPPGRHSKTTVGSCYCPSMTGSIRPVGELLREWRRRRRMSQLDLATEPEITAQPRFACICQRLSSQPVIKPAANTAIFTQAGYLRPAASGAQRVYSEGPFSRSRGVLCDEPLPNVS